MNLNKHDSQTEMKMDMTPMIDVVFLLIIFFMIITDLTQQDLEVIELPIAYNSTPDVPDPKKVRPVININSGGEMIVKKKKLYTPEEDSLKDIEGYLSDQAKFMEKEHFNKEAGTGPLIPADPLLIRADRSTDFKYLQKIMEICGKKDISIWKLQIAAAEDPEKVAARQAAEE
jgi:biopolymer transport protein ExbD